MKTCYRCKEAKPLSEFSKSVARKDGLQNACRPCTKLVNAAYYRKTPEKNPQRRRSMLEACARNAAYTLDYLQSHPCVDCGESDPIVLEFDHVRGKKTRAIAVMKRQALALETIIAEIEKCEVRCANCHRRTTYARAGWTSKS